MIQIVFHGFREGSLFFGGGGDDEMYPDHCTSTSFTVPDIYHKGIYAFEFVAKRKGTVGLTLRNLLVPRAWRPGETGSK